MSAGSSMRKALASNKTSGMATEGQRKDIVGTIRAMEANHRQAFEQMAADINKAFSEINEQVTSMGRAVTALVELTGKDDVLAEVARQRRVELAEESAKVGEAVAAAVAKGAMEAVATVEQPSDLVVSTETGADGTVKMPERIYSPLHAYREPANTLLVGKAVGDVVTLPNGDTVTVREIYRTVPKERRPQESDPGPFAGGFSSSMDVDAAAEPK